MHFSEISKLQFEEERHTLLFILELLTARLYEHYFKKLDCDFETDRIRTWKTICPNCRSIGRLNCC